MLTETEFSELQQRLMSAWHRGDLTSAFTEIETALREGTPEMKGQCLFYQGMIREAEGSLDNAKRDWLEALQYAHEGTFLRYQLEYNVGDANERAGIPQEALSWYRAALTTCSRGDEFSGNKTLTAFLRLSGGEIPPEDRVLVSSVAVKSWRVLELSGEPDLKDLTATVKRLTEEFINTVGKIVENA